MNHPAACTSRRAATAPQNRQTVRRLGRSAVTLAWALVLASPLLQAAPIARNANFAQVRPDGQPEGWNLAGVGYTTRSECAERCMLAAESKSGEQQGGWFYASQNLAPAEAAGHVLRIAVMIRTENQFTKIQVFQRPIVSVHWYKAFYRIG